MIRRTRPQSSAPPSATPRPAWAYGMFQAQWKALRRQRLSSADPRVRDGKKGSLR